MLLENICIEIGATHEMFYKVVKAGLKNQNHKKYFEQVLATLNFMSFKKLMVKRNKELELEALQMLQSEGHANIEEVQAASLNKDQAELEHAISVSIAAEEERRRLEKEEEELIRKIMEESANEYKVQIEAEKIQQRELMLELQRKESQKVSKMEEEQKRKYEEQRAMNVRQEEETRRKIEGERKRIEEKRAEEEKANELRKEAKRIEEEAKKRENEKVLPPVNLKKGGNVDLSEFKKLDVSSELKESEDLDALNKKIADKYQSKSEGKKEESGGENLAERTARLKKQREILLKKKQDERNTEMNAYLQNGGTDLSAKKDLGPLAPIVSQELLDKRREIINKIKQSEI